MCVLMWHGMFSVGGAERERFGVGVGLASVQQRLGAHHSLSLFLITSQERAHPFGLKFPRRSILALCHAKFPISRTLDTDDNLLEC